MQRTRRQILDLLKRKGKATVEELAGETGLVPMTVRAHLGVLARDRLIRCEERRAKIGRPHFVYSLTEESVRHFPQSYDLMANRLIDAAMAIGGDSCTGRLANQIGEIWARERGTATAGLSLVDRVRKVTQFQNEEGALADFSEVDDGYLIRQCHCPTLGCAKKYPDVVCEAEAIYLGKLIGVPIERQEWVLDGGSCCSFLVRTKGTPKTTKDESPALN
jgi:predicted ArsR family transcriptional regulator